METGATSTTSSVDVQYSSCYRIAFALMIVVVGLLTVGLVLQQLFLWEMVDQIDALKSDHQRLKSQLWGHILDYPSFYDPAPFSHQSILDPWGNPWPPTPDPFATP